jgi:hypothetical protein
MQPTAKCVDLRTHGNQALRALQTLLSNSSLLSVVAWQQRMRLQRIIQKAFNRVLGLSVTLAVTLYERSVVKTGQREVGVV